MSETRLCRLCAQTKPVLLDVNNTPDGISIIDLIQLYLALRITVTDLICQECKDHLVTFHQFASQVHNAQEQLKQNIYADITIINPLSIINNCEYNSEHSLEKPCHSNENLVKIEYDSDYIIKKEVKDEDYGWGDFFRENNLFEKPVVKSPSSDSYESDKKKDDSDEFFGDNFFEKSKINVNVLKKERKLKEEKCRQSKRMKNKTENMVKLEKKTKSKPLKKMTKYNKIKPARIKIIDECDPIICYICKEMFTTVLEMRQHQKIHLGQNSYPRWPCTHCEKTFKCKSVALYHIRKVHDQIFDYICHECGKMFCSKGDLKEHLLIHTNIASYECADCGRKFKLRATLLQHLKVHETSFHQCPKCSLLLKSRRTLLNHMLIHDEVGKQVCPFCGKRFKLRKTLKHHINQHTGERPYVCTWCTKTFTNDSNLRIHKKRVHSRELSKYEEENNINNAQRFARHAHLPDSSDVDSNGKEYANEKSRKTKNRVKTEEDITKTEIIIEVEPEITTETDMFTIEHDD